MSAVGPESHPEHAAALAARVADSGETDLALRRAVLAGSEVPDPYRELVDQIAENSARVTDEQVAAVVQATGSQMGAFEVILTAAIGAGLNRWDAAETAIGKATDAPS
ncbi:hypothetical protein [Humibacter sp. RRB41]|uniref:hypothetical protein n=1 Tax=Humibacter sp. RRB41 TaxID=2919946 RepID=UPI001FAAA57F|nr:hypothetical protein [Humibacter sp. RRB41]